MSEHQEQRRLLALVRPPEPISEMTDDERSAFAEYVVDRMFEGYERVVGPLEDD